MRHPGRISLDSFNNPSRTLAAILVLSVLLRLGVALFLGDVVDAPPLLTDQRSYHILGARLVAGHGFSFEGPWYPFTPPNTPTAHWSFLYSLFVAAVYALFGPHPLAVRLVQAVLAGVLLPWLVYRLARRVFHPAVGSERERDESATASRRPVRESERLALLAAFIASIYAYFVLYAATLMTEMFFICAVVWSLERSLRLDEWLRQPGQPRFPTGLVLTLGLSLGIATLLRQSILPWVAVLSLVLAWRGARARRLRQAILALGGCTVIIMLMILPFTLRNARVYGQFLLLNSNAGYAMYSAQHPMHGTNFREFDAAPLPRGMGGLSEPEMDRELMRRGIQFVMDDPGRYLLLSLSRVRAYFKFWPAPETTWLNNLGRTGSFGLFLPLMIYGLFLSLRSSELAARRSLVLLFVAFYSLMHIFTWAMPRYRLPVDAVLIIFAALGLADVYRRIAALRGRWAERRVAHASSRTAHIQPDANVHG